MAVRHGAARQFDPGDQSVYRTSNCLVVAALLATLTNTQPPATDPGFLLREHPEP
jgi:hypothetical protein